MRNLTWQRVIAFALFALSLILIVVGGMGVSMRAGDAGQEILSQMRIQTVLTASGAGVVEGMISSAKMEKQKELRADGMALAEIRTALVDLEETMRAELKPPAVDVTQMDTSAVDAPILALENALRAYYTQRNADVDAYKQQLEASGELEAANAPEEETPDAALASADADGAMDDMMLEEEEPTVDLSGFVDTPQMLALWGEVDARYVHLTAALQTIYPDVEQSAFDAIKGQVLDSVYQDRDTFATQYDRFAQYSDTVLAAQPLMPRIIRFGDDFITIGVALVFIALMVLYHHRLIKSLGMPRLIIGSFFILLCVLALLYDLSLTSLLSNTLVRMGMNSILVLAMVPAIQCGISLNLGLPIGIIGGLLGGLMCIEFKMTGWSGFLFAILIGVAISTVLGYLYGLLLNRLKGSEMAVTTYVGYSIVALMCIAWLVLPFNSLELRWPLGNGLRVTLSMASSYKHLLNNLWAFKIGGVSIPTGLLLFMAMCCFLMWLFQRSKTGIAMQAVGNNPRYAEATGISVNRMRIIGTVLSTALGAIGIIVYSQSYGFMQLYNAPKQMGFVAASAILIGGASTSRARISHVLIGTFLFQGVLTLGMPVANALVPQSTLSETMRILISNGIILYALTKSGGDSRG